jgi:hypothetical protein
MSSLDVIVIELWDRTLHDCAICGELKQCRHCGALHIYQERRLSQPRT